MKDNISIYELTVKPDKIKELPSKEINISSTESEIYVWGSDTHGQLGVSEYSYSNNYCSPRLLKYPINIKSISCGFEHSLLLSETGMLYTMGSNNQGQLGLVT